MNEEILKQLTRIADALELAILPQNNQAYSEKVKETLNVDDAQQELAPKAEPEQSVKTYTHDDLKKLCLVKSREDIVNKPKLKALLKEYGAAKANDVPVDKLAELIAKIESGEF
tara:strand:+ start:386 stop:727 length:342 start_codon:yes stop_codon:yes gene_type:complete